MNSILNLSKENIEVATVRLKRYVKTSAGCWLYLGNINDAGYGRLIIHQKQYKAHRASYELKYGRISDEWILDHKCHDPAFCESGNKCLHRRCINPDHLELSTNLKNTAKGRRKETFHIAHAAVREKHKNQTHCKRGHELSPENTRLYKGTRYCKSCVFIYEKTRKDKRALGGV